MPKLIDFGVAKSSAASTLTRTGMVIGTPQFMAPEQLDGSRETGPAADVFALAGVPTFAATGLIVCVVAYLACYLPAGRAALSPVNGSATFTSDDLQGLRLSDRVDTSLLILNTRASARVR